jgi:hypothetical protein
MCPSSFRLMDVLFDGMVKDKLLKDVFTYA